MWCPLHCHQSGQLDASGSNTNASLWFSHFVLFCSLCQSWWPRKRGKLCLAQMLLGVGENLVLFPKMPVHVFCLATEANWKWWGHLKNQRGFCLCTSKFEVWVLWNCKWLNCLMGYCLSLGDHAPKGLFHSCIKLSDFTVVNCKNTNFSTILTTIAQPHTGSFSKEEITLHFTVSQKSFFATSFPLFLFPVFPLEAIEDQEPHFTQCFWYQWTPPRHAPSNPAAAWQLCIMTQSSVKAKGHQEKQAARSIPLACLS